MQLAGNAGPALAADSMLWPAVAAAASAADVESATGSPAIVSEPTAKLTGELASVFRKVRPRGRGQHVYTWRGHGKSGPVAFSRADGRGQPHSAAADQVQWAELAIWRRLCVDALDLGIAGIQSHAHGRSRGSRLPQ